MSILLKNIGQLATCPGDNPQSDAGLLSEAAVFIEGQNVSWAGKEADLPPGLAVEKELDCEGMLLVPGLIDCHTHLCFGGWRNDEFVQRLAGASYQDIAAGGGGIRRTVAATRDADDETLLKHTVLTLDAMLELGVTTVEGKSGYGLDARTELRQLEIYRQAQADHDVDLLATFLGAHVVPPEFASNRSAYLDLLMDTLLPKIARNGLARYCDVFVEAGAFSTEEARKLLAKAADLGLGLKIHADQLSNGGGARLAADLGALSAEHLEYADDHGIAAMAKAHVVAVSLPLASLYLGERYLPARKFMQAGVRVAVATDFNPGSAPSYHLPLAMTLACLNQHMTPQEVLMGSTTIAARALGIHREVGSVARGFKADLALIDAPSLEHWLMHFVPNACRRVIKKGALLR